MFYFSGKPESAFRPDILFPSNLKVWLRADRGVTSVAGAVSSITNYGSLGGTFDQATGSKRPTLGTLRGQASLSFDGGDYLVSSLAKANFAFIHNGSGATVAIFHRWRSVTVNAAILDTSNAPYDGVNGTGFCLSHTSTQLQVLIGKGSVAYAINRTGRGNYQICTSFDIIRIKTGGITGLAKDCDWLNNGAHYGDTVTGAFSASDPSYTLTLGACSGAGGIPMVGHVSEVIILDKFATDQEVTDLETYAIERYGWAPAQSS